MYYLSREKRATRRQDNRRQKYLGTDGLLFVSKQEQKGWDLSAFVVHNRLRGSDQVSEFPFLPLSMDLNQ